MAQQAPKTFHFQKHLKPLPVPELYETCQRYLRSLKPLLSNEEYQHSQAVVAKFVSPGGIGEHLHEKLVLRKEQKQEEGKSWLEDWWLEYGYLRYRAPLPLNLSCFILAIPGYVSPESFTQTQQAARFTSYFLEWQRALYREEIAPEFARSNPLDMSQLEVLFTTERQPGSDIDTIVTVKPSNRLVVLCKDQFFTVTTRKKRKNISMSELEYQFSRIKTMAGEHASSTYQGVSTFTTMKRGEWAAIRTDLEKDDHNSCILHEIERSPFVLVLDDRSPRSPEEMTALTAMSGENRWYDKLFCLVIYENAQVGVLLEHTPCDAPAVSKMFDWAIVRMRNENPSVPVLDKCYVSPPTRLVWNLSKTQLSQLAMARRDHEVIEKKCDFELVQFQEFGTSLVKKLRCSPDVFMQVVLQMAYYKLYGHGTATYETGHTRFFLHGRTETVRTYSSSMLAFLESMESPKHSATTRYFLLKGAHDAHLQYMKAATQGKGCDRYLFGLRILHSELYPGQPLPAIFRDPAYERSCTFKLSTSNVPGQAIWGGFGFVVEDGYGVNYIIKSDRLDFTICSKCDCPTTSSLRMKDAITESIHKLRNLVEEITMKKSNL